MRMLFYIEIVVFFVYSIHLNSCGVSSYRVNKYTLYDSVQYKIDSICILSDKIILNENDRKFEDFLFQKISSSNKVKYIVRIDTLLTQLVPDKGLTLNPDLSYLKTIYSKTGIRYFLLAKLNGYQDGQGTSASTLYCALKLKDVALDSNLLVFHEGVDGKSEHAIIADILSPRKDYRRRVNTSSERELVYPAADTMFKLMFKHINHQ